MGLLLAARLSPPIRFNSLPKIRIGSQPPTTNPAKILEAFPCFYSKLYSRPDPSNAELIPQFLEGLPIPSLNDDHRQRMETPITVEEVLGVIKYLKKGSAPGPDGLSIPYYKSFVNTLAPHLTSFFNSKTNGDPWTPTLIQPLSQTYPNLTKITKMLVIIGQSPS